MLRLAGRASWWGLGGGGAQIATIISVAVVARLVDETVFGTYRQLILLHGIVTILFIFSLGSSILHFAGTDDDISAARSVFGLQLLLGAVASAALVGLAPITARLFGNPDLFWAQIVFAPYSMIVAVTVSVPVLLHATGRRVWATVALAGQPVAVAAGLAVAALVDGSAVALAAGLVVGSIVGAAATYTMARLATGRRIGPVYPRRARTLLGYALPLGVAAGINLVGYQTDQIVVAVLASPAVFAVYAAGAIEVPAMRLIRDALTVSAIPTLAGALREANTRLFLRVWGDTIRVAGLVLLPFAVTMWIAAPAVIGLLFGPRYEESATYFRLYLFAVPLRLFWHDGVLIATGKTRPAMLVTAVFAVVNVVLNLIGWYTIGIVALPLATVVAVAISAALFLRVGAGQLGVRVWRLLPLRSLVPGVVLAVLVAVAVVASGVNRMDSDLRSVVATGLVAGTTWLLAAGVYFGRFRRDPGSLDQTEGGPSESEGPSRARTEGSETEGDRGDDHRLTER